MSLVQGTKHSGSQSDGESSYVPNSMSTWKSQANKVCANGQEAAYRYSKALEALKKAKADLERGNEIADHVHSDSYDGAPTPFRTGELQPLPILQLCVQDAELECEKRKPDYDGAKQKLLTLLDSAEKSQAQAKTWSAPKSPSRFADALDETEQYHKMEAEFLTAIVDQLRNALCCMERQVLGMLDPKPLPKPPDEFRNPDTRFPPDPVPLPPPQIPLPIPLPGGIGGPGPGTEAPIPWDPFGPLPLM